MKSLNSCFGIGLGLIIASTSCKHVGPKSLTPIDQLKITCAENFPKVLESEIRVGNENYPYFRTKGERGVIDTAGIEINLATSLSVVRKGVKSDSYALYLFTEDAEGKVIGFFDLDIDGIWDVKKAPTRAKNFIFADGDWIEVPRVDGLYSDEPTAEVGGVKYQFQGGWRTISETNHP